jgi:hypothetical protein
MDESPKLIDFAEKVRGKGMPPFKSAHVPWRTRVIFAGALVAGILLAAGLGGAICGFLADIADASPSTARAFSYVGALLGALYAIEKGISAA